MAKNTKGKKLSFSVVPQIIVWVVVFFSPLMFIHNSDDMMWNRFFVNLLIPLAVFVVYYLNNLLLAPKFFIRSQRLKFFIINGILIISIAIGLNRTMEYLFIQILEKQEMAERLNQKATDIVISDNVTKVTGKVERNYDSIAKENTPNLKKETNSPEGRNQRQNRGGFRVFFVVRNILGLMAACFAATLFVVVRRLNMAENARKEAESAKTEAELRNLRSQINPHFLLNTLNNIYALTAFDADKAQEAIIELSKLLRHVLYETKDSQVKVCDEVLFMENYINLMKIRLSSHTTVNAEFDIEEKDNLYVAPLLFISVIENAFKHGISATDESFIDIRFKAREGQISCIIENSNHPKSKNDNSGHGIGLAQVERRLNLYYKDKYDWEHGTKDNDSIYFSKINIYDTQLHNN